MTAAHSLRARDALASGSATAMATPDRGRPARRDEVSWAIQALAAQGGGSVPAIPRRLEWSTAMVHSA
jgi:hypothetical protein